MPSLSGFHLIGNVSKAALSAVAPLADAAELAIIQPLAHGLFVAVVKEGHVKLAAAARRDLLTVGKAPCAVWARNGRWQSVTSPFT